MVAEGVADEAPVERCTGKNGKCNRPLKDPESKRRKIGPVCEAREAWRIRMQHGPTVDPPPPRARKPRRRKVYWSGPDLLDELKAMEENADG